MKTILGLDLGTNSIGWALIQQDFEQRQGEILGMGSRILPMSQDILGKFDSGQSISQTAERTGFRGIRRLLERDLLRRERLHRVLNILGFLPKHYAEQIDFEHRLGQFKKGCEPKIAYAKNDEGKYEFIFQKSFLEMLEDFKIHQPALVANSKKVPQDWTIYYLRKKALTQKIDKDELAWILLNFNQKRGYYQLRGEEEEVDNTKSIKFYALKVTKVEEGEKGKGKDEIWYNVHLENGWIYRRSSKTKLEWEGKTKEFIVTEDLNEDGTIKTDKDGKEKRSFKAVDSEQDWIAIKKSTEEKIENSKETVGEYIYNTLLQKPNQKIRGKLVRTIERKFYKDELRQILEKQATFHTELQNGDLYKNCLEELYAFNDAHKQSVANRDFTYLFMDDIIFYQRPLKSKKSLISDCTLESRKYKDENGVEKIAPLKCIAKSHPLYQEFRLLQWFKNLRLFKKSDRNDIDITNELLTSQESKTALYNWLYSKSEITQKDILLYEDFALVEKVFKDHPSLEKSKAGIKKVKDNIHEYYRWNFVEDKVYPLNETRSSITKRLEKIKIDTSFLSQEIETQLWHILFSVEDKFEIEKALKKFSEKHQLGDEFAELFRKFPPLKKEYGSYSEKAIHKLLSLMRMGDDWSFEVIDEKTKQRISNIITGEYDEKLRNRVREKAINLTEENHFQDLPLWLASYIIYDRHSETGDVQYWKTAKDIELLKQHSLRNPIVEQVINETLQVIRDIWNTFGEGKENFFDEIHVELGREMKNPADKRRQMTENVTQNENTNLRIKALLMEFMEDKKIENVRPYSPMQQEILKLYEEGVYGNESNEEKLKDIDAIRKKNQPTKADLNRYKLWLEQGYISPYTGLMIPLHKLFTPAYEIEHIIPQSRYFDDSFTNKIICEAEVNSLKDNQLAYEFIKNNKGEKVQIGNKFVDILTIEAYEQNVKKYFAKNKTKMRKLMMDEIPEAFIQRQLNDSRYISKVVKSLLSNIVRQEGETEGIAKNVVPGNGGVTARLRQDWGLNDVWNDLIAPRFMRLNELTNTDDFGKINPNTNKFLPEVPIDQQKGFNKKRIDHRHHALDALVIACATRSHINYLNNESASENKKSERFDLRNKLRLIEKVITKEGKEISVAKDFIKPWKDFTKDAKDSLDNIIVSFKQNNRVINKTTNHYQKWEKQADGTMKKVFVKQTKGDSWAIRKPLHKDTVSGLVSLPKVKVLKDKQLTATRKTIDGTLTLKQIESITDESIQRILKNHLSKYNGNDEEAFGSDGLEQMNKNLTELNNGKSHQPIYKVRIYEVGSKFNVGTTGNKGQKFVEAAKGTNLFFAIYQNEKGERNYETIPLNIVIENQKQGALNGEKPSECSVPKQNEKGDKLLFSLSPNDLVYVPTQEEIENPNLVNFEKLSKEQCNRVYKIVSFTGNRLYGVLYTTAKAILDKVEYTQLNKVEQTDDKISLKSVCWKLQVNRIGKIISCKK